MDTVENRRPGRALIELVSITLSVVLVALVSGHPAAAEVVGGLVVMAGATLAISRLARRVTREREPGRVLALDLLISVVIVVGLGGVAVMAAALP